jgi:hypothetical protein|tara:strand:- start:3962 stop:4117 length:156 start_codon:yes stop_codon:yes gene_type:complete
METVSVSKQELEDLRERAELGDELMVKLVKGLEDVKHGRIESWDSFKESKR